MLFFNPLLMIFAPLHTRDKSPSPRAKLLASSGGHAASPQRARVENQLQGYAVA